MNCVQYDLANAIYLFFRILKHLLSIKNRMKWCKVLKYLLFV